MRVVDALLLALAFDVSSIVCSPPPIPNPDPPYRVVRMLARHLPDAYVEYETKRPGSAEGYTEYYRVQGFLDVVIKGDIIIGRVNHKDELAPIYDQNGHIFQKLKLGYPATNPEPIYSEEAGQLGMGRKLPENTIYEHPLNRGDPPPYRRIIHKDAEGNVIYTELLPWRPWRRHPSQPR